MEETSRQSVSGPARSTQWLDEVWVRPFASAPPSIEPLVHPDRAVLDLSGDGDGCGKGSWCPKCRREIHQEALRWIQELNAPLTWEAAAGSIPHWTWHQELLLGNI